jgi:hypothetical protein
MIFNKRIIVAIATAIAASFTLSASAAGLDLQVDSRKLKKRLEETGSRDLDSYEAKRIFKDYRENEVAADGKYKGKWFVVTGKVSEISKDFRDKPYLVFAMDGYGMSNVRADLFEDQVCGASKEKGVTSCPATERAAKLKKGQSLDLECKGGGMVVKMPILRECLISD